MNTLQFRIFLVFVTVAETAVSAAVTDRKMTWEDVFRDRLEVNGVKRRQRSHFSTKKAYVLDPGFESSDQGQHSLQYIDQYEDGHLQDKLLANQDYKYLAVSDESDFGKDKLTTGSIKPPLSFIYTEAEQPHKFVTEAYKFVTVPQVNLHQSPESGHHYHKPRDYDNGDNYASKYKFGYRVSDPHSGVEFGHSEVSEGHTKKGHYHVLLPDGRLQNVKYWAGPSGYHATVTYEGHSYHYPYHH